MKLSLNNLRRTSSYLKQIVVTYILLLSIPSVILVSTLAYTSASYKRSIYDNTSMMLENISSNLDDQIYEMTRIKDCVFRNSSFIKSIPQSTSRNSERYNYVVIKNYLSSLLTNDYYDIFIYYAQNDVIVPASTSVCDSLTYYRALFSGNQISYEDWVSQITAYSSETYSRFIMPGGAQTILYTSLSPYYSGARRRENGIYLNFVPNADKLQALLTQNAVSDLPTDVTLYAPDEKPLVSTNPSFVNESASFEDGFFSHKFSFGKYMVYAKTSELTGFQYVIYLPFSAYRHPVDKFRITLIVLFAAFVVLSGFISFFLARHMYSPVSRLTRKVQQIFPAGADTGNEFDAFSHAFDSVLSEKNKLARRLVTESEHLVTSIMLQAFHHTLPKNFDLKATLKNLNINVNWDFCCIGILELCGEIDETQDYAPLIESGLYDCAASCISFLVFQTELQRYAVFYNFAQDSIAPAQIIEMSRQVLNTVLKDKNIDFAMGISLPVSLYEIHTAYSHALQALEYQTICGLHSIQTYEAIKNKQFNYNHDAMKLTYHKLKAYICGKSAEVAASEIYTEIRSSCFDEEQASREVFQCFRYDMINTLLKVASDYQITDKNNQLVEGLLHTTTIREFDAAIVHFLEEAKSYYENLLVHPEKDLVSEVRDYLDRNYTDHDININWLGDYFHISPSYLSRQFKEQMGISPLSYLSSLRIAKSRELLVNSDETITKIAEKCGFLSNEVFIRSFKKETGITPGEFRKSSRR